MAILTVLAVMVSGCGGAIRADELSRSVDTLVSSAGEGEVAAPILFVATNGGG